VRGSHSKRDDPAICEVTARRAEFLPLRGIPCVFAAAFSHSCDNDESNAKSDSEAYGEAT
jgi:hypothetical protein